jgi:hypothetical protein
LASRTAKTICSEVVGVGLDRRAPNSSAVFASGATMSRPIARSGVVSTV